MDEEAWCAAVLGVTESRTRLSNCTELKAKLVQHCYVLCCSMCGCGAEHGFRRQRVLGYNLCSVPPSFIYSADIQCMPPTWSCLDRLWAEAGSRKLELLVVFSGPRILWAHGDGFFFFFCPVIHSRRK